MSAPSPEPVAWFRAPYGTIEPNPLFRVTGPQSLEWAVPCFTETQLREAVAAARRQALEDAALWLDAEHETSKRSHNYAAFYARCIRARMEKP